MTHDPVIISKMPRQNFRCRDWNSIGYASIGAAIFASTVQDGITTIFAASAGATSQTLTIEFISAMPIAFCSRARDKAWSYSFRPATRRSYALASVLRFDV